MKFCNRPFYDLHVRPRSYTICCNNWFTDTSGRQVETFGEYDDMWKMWNSAKFKNLRRHWLKGNGALCKNCPLAFSGIESMGNREDFEKDVLTTGPRNIFFANDLTCQLHCWSCRSQVIINKQQERIFNQTYNVLHTFAESIKFFSAIGSGDPFASPAWRKILQTMDMSQFNDPDIEIFTNGILLPKYWDSLSVRDNIKIIKMSIDAASKDVYERTRLGSKYEDMKEAIKFISKLDRKFIINMCVQSDNFTDIPEFINMGLENNASVINITALQYWPQMRGGRARFDETSLSNPEHPKRKEFEKLLKENEDLLNHPKVESFKLRLEFLSSIHNKNNA